MQRTIGVVAVLVGSGLCSALVSCPTLAQDSSNYSPPGVATPPTLGAPPALHGQANAPTNPQVAIATPAPSTSAAPALDTYHLGAGDHVRINVFGQQDLSGLFSIDGAGNLSYPLIGEVHAAGMTSDQLQQALIARLSPKYIKQPSVSVEVITYRPFYILGEVRTPGSYPYVSGMTALQAIAIAGGFTYRAHESSFEITRNGASGSKVHIDVTPDTTIEPGDVITVDERYF